MRAVPDGVHAEPTGKPREDHVLTDDDWALLARHTEVENAHQLAETLATLTPDCVFEDVPLGTTYHGRDEAGRYYRMWWDGLDPTVAVERVHEVAGGTAVVAETVWHGRHIGRFLGVEPTGKELSIPLVIVAELRDGLLAAERLYWDRATVVEQLRPDGPAR